MGIGFVIFIWLAFFGILALGYLFLRLIAEESYFAGVLKDAFLALIGVSIVLVAALLIITVGGVILDYLFPARIFTNNFGFDPPANVHIIEGSSFWTPLGYSTHLKFQADEKTIEKIVLNDFTEVSKKFLDADSVETNEILSQPQSRYYRKKVSVDGGNSAYLVYDRQNQIAYFSFHTVD